MKSRPFLLNVKAEDAGGEEDLAEVVMEDVSSSTAHLLAKLSLISVQLRDGECFIPINCLSINGRFFIFLVSRMTSGEIFGQF